MGEVTQLYRPLSVGTPLGPDKLLLRSFAATEQLGRPFQFDLDLLSEDDKIKFDDIVGKNVTVRIENVAGTRYFNGYVSRFVQTTEGSAGRYAAYQATVVPWLWFLTRTADCRIFQKKTVPDIIKEVFRGHGFTDFKDRLSGTYTEWEYCVQYRETDFNFVSRLMEQVGIYYYFTHENGLHTLVLSDAPSSHDKFPGYDKVTYRSSTGGYSEGEEVSNWVVGKEVQPGAYAYNDFDFEKPDLGLLVSSKSPGKHPNAEFEIYDYPGEYVKFADGERYAKVRIQELAAQREVSHGQGDVRGVCAGFKFKLQDAPRADLDKEYLVLSTSISASNDEFTGGGSTGGSGATFSCSFSAIEATVQFRPARLTPKPVIQGPQTAMVVGPPGEEIFTDKYGRVKVQFHWDRESKANENSSCWIRVAQVWAGAQWGAMHIPRVGHEVMVEFLEGDPDHPVVTGRLYNGNTMPPWPLPDKKTFSGFKTSTTKGGGGFNELRFDDMKGCERVFLHAEKWKDERVKSTSKEWVGGSRNLIVGGDQLEKVGGDKHLQVKGDQNEKVDMTISQEAGMNLQQKVGMNHAMDAGLEIHLKAGLNVVIEAGLMLTLKAGASFITIGPTGVTIVGTPLTLINSGGAAGTGSGSSPTAPKDPAAALTDRPGKTTKVIAPPPPATAPFTSSDARVAALKEASASGTPFVEQCPPAGGAGATPTATAAAADGGENDAADVA